MQGLGAVQRTSARIRPAADERRRHQRVRVNLLGRYMLADRREYPCQVIDMSPGGMALIAPVAGEPGERVIAYVDHLGRLEGKIARILDNGFAMSISATLRKRDKLAAQLTWLANRQILNLPEDRRHGRFTPKNPIARLILPNGVNVACRVIDLSQSGAAISKKASRWSSRACSTRTPSKRTPRRSKRAVAAGARGAPHVRP